MITLQDVIPAIRTSFPHFAGEITAATTADDVPGWDSAAHVDLIMNLEERFKVEFDNEEIVAFDNMGELVDLLNSKGAV